MYKRQALTATVKAIQLDEGNIEALQNLKIIASDIKINTFNKDYARKAYELLLNCNNFSHRKLCQLFVQDYLNDIEKATKSDSIILDNNQAFDRLASDLRFRKSLTLLIPPHQKIEEFLTRLRKDFLFQTKSNSTIPPKLKPLLEALATQCFLNEYVYWQSNEEQQWVESLIKKAKQSRAAFREYLPIIGCYTPIHSITTQEDINKYPIPSIATRARPSSTPNTTRSKQRRASKPDSIAVTK